MRTRARGGSERGRAALALGVAALLFLGAGAGRAEDAAEAPEAEAAETNSTVITSARLIYDQQKQTAVFEDQVVVTDPRVTITADKLTVLFTQDQKVSVLEAEGSVVIREGDKNAAGEKARYEVAEGKFVLTGRPQVQNGRDLLSADTITFWRNSNRIQGEPNVRLVIRSEQGGLGERLLKPKE